MADIEASFDTQLRQAHLTAADYLAQAVHTLDERFGDGYAAKHPALLTAMINAASNDFNGAVEHLAKQKIAAAIGGLTKALEYLHWDWRNTRPMKRGE